MMQSGWLFLERWRLKSRLHATGIMEWWILLGLGKCKAFLIALSLTSVTQLGCGSERPSRIVQLCVTNEDGLTDFKEEIRRIAQDNGYTFIDSGKRVTSEINAIDKATQVKPHIVRSVLFIGIESEQNRNLLMAGNFGLANFQIAIGFANSTVQDQNFSTMVVEQLNKRWKVIPEADGASVLPIASCN